MDNSITKMMNDPLSVLKQNNLVPQHEKKQPLPFFSYTYLHPDVEYEMQITETGKKLFLGGRDIKYLSEIMPPKKENKDELTYDFVSARGYSNVIAYYTAEDAEIALKNAKRGKLDIVEELELSLLAVAAFTRGATMDYKSNRSPVWVSSIAGLLDHLSFAPLSFYYPIIMYLTRRLKIEYFDGCHDSIFEDDLCACKSVMSNMTEKRITVETMMYCKGKPIAKSTFIGGSLPYRLPLNTDVIEESIEFSKNIESWNFGVFKIFSNTIAGANGDSSKLCEANAFMSFDETKIEEYCKSVMQSDKNIAIISTTADPSTRPIGGGSPCIRHRLFYNNETKKYSAVVQYSVRAEGPPGRAHGGAITETLIDFIALVAQHLIAGPVDINRLNVKVMSVDVDFLGGVTLNHLVRIPEIKYELKGDCIEFTAAVEDDGKISFRLSKGIVLVNDKNKSMSSKM